MSYISTRKDQLSLPALAYSIEENVLTVGQRTLPMEPSWIEEHSPWNLVPFDGPNQLDRANVCLNPHAKPIGAPRFHEWLGRVAADNGLAGEVKSSTIEVIRSVFVALEPNIEIPDTGDPGPFGFNMSVTPNSHARLYTYGDCACLGPNPEGHWAADRDWDEGYCEYDWHNTFADTQIWSLLAGMGHLARLASQEQ